MSELERLRSELVSAAQRGEIDQELATEAESRLAQARNEANKPQPDRGRFLGLLSQAQDLLKTVASAAGRVSALGQLAEVAKQLF